MGAFISVLVAPNAVFEDSFPKFILGAEFQPLRASPTMSSTNVPVALRLMRRREAVFDEKVTIPSNYPKNDLARG